MPDTLFVLTDSLRLVTNVPAKEWFEAPWVGPVLGSVLGLIGVIVVTVTQIRTTRKLEQQKEQHQEKMQQQINDHQLRVERERQNHQEKMEQQRNEYQLTLERQKDEFQQRIEREKVEHQRRIERQAQQQKAVASAMGWIGSLELSIREIRWLIRKYVDDGRSSADVVDSWPKVRETDPFLDSAQDGRLLLPGNFYMRASTVASMLASMHATLLHSNTTDPASEDPVQSVRNELDGYTKELARLMRMLEVSWHSTWPEG